EAIIEDLHIEQGVMMAVTHNDPGPCATDHDPAEGHSVDDDARMTIQIYARGRAGDRRIPRLAAVGQRSVAPSVDHHGTVVPGSGGPLDDDVILANGEGAVTLPAGNTWIRR